ncbi:unnamed protein product [Owenia fusiformis]|uniref:Glutathione S-transferase n=1 Tax=Owenia fusiformis TaxID=6347 RepID=A0A8S4PZK2_OWEFU|nr:unnamed protein product [Owenia fusiformis]
MALKPPVTLEAAIQRRRSSALIPPRREDLEIKANCPVLYLSKRNPQCRIVWLYLLQNNITHEIVDVDDGAAETTASLHSCNPHGSTPTLSDGDVVVFENPAVLYYLSERYTNGHGMGANNKVKYKAESIMNWAAASLYRSVITNYVNPKVARQEFEDLLTNKELSHLAKTEVREHLNAMETQYLQNHKYITGNEPLFVDHYVAMIVTMLDLVSYDFKQFPKVKAWLQNVKLLDKQHWELVNETHNLQVIQRGSRRASYL